MDFILSLTHFCEVHGPTSILCSQLLPLECPECTFDSSDVLFTPASPFLSQKDGSPSRRARKGSAGGSGAGRSNSNAADLASPSRRGSTRAPGSQATELASSPKTAPSPVVSEPPVLLSPPALNVPEPASFPSSIRQTTDETCASCSLVLPEGVGRKQSKSKNGGEGAASAKDSSKAQGSHQSSGQNKSNGTVLRSIELVSSCDNEYHESDHDHPHALLPRIPENTQARRQLGSSLHSDHSGSSMSSSSINSSCHKHALFYISYREPRGQNVYRFLRQASIRTLSCELLPKGLSSGPLTFGDTESGYVIAYVFRIPDQMARGKRRSYALIALAGHDARTAFRACPIIWRSFSKIANKIIRDAEKEMERSRPQSPTIGMPPTPAMQRDFRPPGPPGVNAAASRNYNKPVSSMLTGRARTQTFHSSAGPGASAAPGSASYRSNNLHSTTSPYGGSFARLAAGKIRARNLTEIVGNPYVFTELHAEFTFLLKELRGVFPGVMPRKDSPYHDSFPMPTPFAHLQQQAQQQHLAEECARCGGPNDTIASTKATTTTPTKKTGRKSVSRSDSKPTQTTGLGLSVADGAGLVSSSSHSSSLAEDRSSPASATTSATTASHGASGESADAKSFDKDETPTAKPKDAGKGDNAKRDATDSNGGDDKGKSEGEKRASEKSEPEGQLTPKS